MSRLRVAGRIGWLLALLLLCLPLHGGWRLARLPSPWPRRFLRWAARACGVRVALAGQPLRRDVLVLSNHLSWLDILVLGGGIGCAFVAKAELAGVPLVGWLCRLHHTIFVERADRRSIPAQLAAIRAGLAQGPVAVFPEATTGDGTALLPFRPALLQVLDGAGPALRVQPVFLDYGPLATEIAWGDEDGTRNALRLLGRRGTIPVTLRCLEPFAPAGAGDRKAVAAEARRRIAAAAGNGALCSD